VKRIQNVRVGIAWVREHPYLAVLLVSAIMVASLAAAVPRESMWHSILMNTLWIDLMVVWVTSLIVVPGHMRRDRKPPTP